MTTLDTLTSGSEALVVEIGGVPSFRRRLMEMGFLPGTPVRMIRHMTVGGVLELEVRRSRVSLRRNEASQLIVSRP